MKARILISDWIFFSIVLAFFIFFFYQIHPLIPYDTDDWLFMGIERPPHPSLSCFNPTKVLPELSQSFVSALGGYLIVPLVNDYVCGMTLTNALAVALCIVAYLWSVERYIVSRFGIGRLAGHALTIVFILLHFMVLRTKDENNEHLWYTHDVTCYYHYIIPTMLCASLVLWLMRHDNPKAWSGRTIAILIPLVYLALCSNLYSEVVLIAYIGSVLVFDLFKVVRPGATWLRDYVRRNICYLVVIALWALIQWYEANGIRANGFGYLHEPFIISLKVTVYNFLTLRYNLWFLIITLLILIGVKVYDVRTGGRRIWYLDSQSWSILFSLLLSFAYLMLLSSRVDPKYIQRGDVILGYAFFYFLLVLMAMAHLIRCHRHIVWVTPLLIAILYLLTDTPGKTYKDVMEEYAPDLAGCIDIDRNIVRQICDADAAGHDTVSICVPTYSKHGYNWPLMVTDYASQYYGHALYMHNQTKREVRVTFVPSYIIDE